MEVLICLLDGEGGFLSGFKERGKESEGMKVFHLLFANNTLFFCKDSQDRMVHLSWLLMWFETTLGLKIN